MDEEEKEEAQSDGERREREREKRVVCTRESDIMQEREASTPASLFARGNLAATRARGKKTSWEGRDESTGIIAGNKATHVAAAKCGLNGRSRAQHVNNDRLARVSQSDNARAR